MNITLTLGDFLAIAAIVVIFGRGTHAYFGRSAPDDLRMRRQLDAIMNHLGLPEPPMSRTGSLSPQVVALLSAGRKIDAIKLYRQETGEPLKRAKEAVEKHPAAATTSG